MGKWDGWEDYEPPVTIEGHKDGKRILVDHGPVRPADPDDPLPILTGGQRGGGKTLKLDRGRGMMRAKVCYVDLRSLILHHEKPENGVPDHWRRFQSRREARRAIVLIAQSRAGEIHDLAMQVPLPCYAVRQKDGVRALVGHYLVDFVYTGANGIV